VGTPGPAVEPQTAATPVGDLGDLVGDLGDLVGGASDGAAALVPAWPLGATSPVGGAPGH
jgi:hypothetical protein